MKDPEGTTIQKIDTITFRVVDLQRSLHFYGEILDLKFSQQSASAAEILLNGVRLLLHVDTDPSLKDSSAPRGAGMDLHFWVSDVDACYQKLLRRGVHLDEQPANHPWGREFAVKDPDGYRIELIGPST